MGKVKRLELWWQLYRTSFPVWDLENFRPMDFYWHDCTLSCLSCKDKFRKLKDRLISLAVIAFPFSRMPVLAMTLRSNCHTCSTLWFLEIWLRVFQYIFLLLDFCVPCLPFSSFCKVHMVNSFIHSVFCLSTGPKPPPKRCLHIVRCRASTFKWEYPLLSLRSYYWCFKYVFEFIPYIHTVQTADHLTEKYT